MPLAAGFCLRLVGTGWWFEHPGDDSLFLTALHVFDRDRRHTYWLPTADTLQFDGTLASKQLAPLEIKHRVKKFDLAIGSCPDIDPAARLVISNDAVHRGDELMMGGYPFKSHASVEWTRGQQMNIEEFRTVLFKPGMVREPAGAYHDAGTPEHPYKVDGFRFDAMPFKSMSGGPVLDDGGRVRGLLNASKWRLAYIADQAGDEGQQQGVRVPGHWGLSHSSRGGGVRSRRLVGNASGRVC